MQRQMVGIVMFFATKPPSHAGTIKYRPSKKPPSENRRTASARFRRSESGCDIAELFENAFGVLEKLVRQGFVRRVSAFTRRTSSYSAQVLGLTSGGMLFSEGF
jgi:hypothetical protein